ncbi:integrase arm-type DNA-binding domain-containing protein [Ponticaulis sp.]|uniref:tyrosine-type recombinase/integrase n=1 Tax=Ponticaulis sp. TaxID=2020902 RepID=UPI000B71DE7D|nr:integrase arm-type DNA-binding domain-containing protein [Ponticaulis sp.]MAI89210.1 integrase [Ponticaulis sp.]OUY01204.1 MAG: integrase [Hyphomonadaceae bacterium TMED5]|tara:strand:- start:59374 stop:60603 length:1230 start_codon:yes stop_codon:yes gene_type:complete
MPLTETACKNAKSDKTLKKLSDGGGLQLHIKPNGSKLWRLAYRFQGKQKTISFGAYPIVTLKEARKRRDAAKEFLSNGVDPSAHRQAEKAKLISESEHTFKKLALEWFENRKHSWTPGYSDRLLSRMEADLFPKLGHRPIKEIEPPELLQVIRAIEDRGAIEMAKRVLQAASHVFRYAIACNIASRDPSQDLRGALKTPPPTKHRTALKAQDLPNFFEALAQYDGERQTVLGLKLIMHTFLRTNELRLGRWEEIEDWDTSTPIWRIPASRMKMRAEHIVPITEPVREILVQLKEISGSNEFMFPSITKRTGVMSENTLIFAIYRLGYHSKATVHGFRGTASTILNEHQFNSDWIERQLAHVERNEVRAAYNSALYLPQRRNMMEWWSAYLNSVENGDTAKISHLRVVNN